MHEGAAHKLIYPPRRTDQPACFHRLSVEPVPDRGVRAEAVLDASHDSPREVRHRGRRRVPELRQAAALLADVPAARLRHQLHRLHRPPAARADARPADLGVVGASPTTALYVWYAWTHFGAALHGRRVRRRAAARRLPDRSAAAVHRAQPDAARQQERLAQLRVRVLGDASSAAGPGDRRATGNIISCRACRGTSS